eukprot:SAG31_NODE_21552_length_546_cov_1.277405_2_plen_72_part_00
MLNSEMGDLDEDTTFLDNDDTVMSALADVNEVAFLAGKLSELAAANSEVAVALTGALDAEHSAILQRVMAG